MQKAMEVEKNVLVSIADGDTKAFGLLFECYSAKVYGYARSILHSEAEAEEIVQHVFIKLWLKRRDLAAVNNFGGFLRVLVRNETLNALKQTATIKRLHQGLGSRLSELSSDTEDAVHFRETNKILEEAIQKLPPQQKLVYSMCKLEGLKHKDVADKLNISPLTVKSHLQEAVKFIKAYLSSHDQVRLVPILLLFLK